MIAPTGNIFCTTKTLLAGADMTRQAFTATVQSADMQEREMSE
jgi:hypothetical protein